MNRRNNIIHSKSTRNTTIEILRFFFMFCIMSSHIYGHGMHLDYETIFHWGLDPNKIIHLMLFSLEKIGVTGFIILSGFYKINLKLNKVLELLFICLFYIIVCSLSTGEPPYLFTILCPHNSYWYISAYIYVMLASPFINIGIDLLNNKQLFGIISCLWYLIYFSDIFQNSHNASFLLSLYIMTVGIKRFHPLINVRYIYFLGLISFLFIILTPVILVNLNFECKYFKLLFSNNNFLYFVLAYSLVIYCNKHPIYNKRINWLFSSTLSIYLITDNSNLRYLIDETLLPLYMDGYGYLLGLLLCIICLLIDKIRIYIFFIISRFYSFIKSFVAKKIL